MVMKIFVELSIVILLSVFLGHELVRNRSCFMNGLRQLNIAYNPLIKRSSRTPGDSEYLYSGFKQCPELNILSIGVLIICIGAFLGWMLSWFGCFKSKETNLVQASPPRHQVLPHIIHLHELLSGLLQPTGVPYPLSICPSIVPLVNFWWNRISEQEISCNRYLDEHSDELVEAMRNVMDLIDERKFRLSSNEKNQQVFQRSPFAKTGRGVHTLDLTPLERQPPTPRSRLNEEFGYPFSRQIAAPQMKRTDESEEPMMSIVEEPESSSAKTYVVLPKMRKAKKGKVMNIEIEFESEKEECPCG